MMRLDPFQAVHEAGLDLHLCKSAFQGLYSSQMLIEPHIHLAEHMIEIGCNHVKMPEFSQRGQLSGVLIGIEGQEVSQISIQLLFELPHEGIISAGHIFIMRVDQMEGIVCERWHKYKGYSRKAKGCFDLSEAPQAYKDIESVIDAERDLVEPLVRLVPMASLKG